MCIVGPSGLAPVRWEWTQRVGPWCSGNWRSRVCTGTPLSVMEAERLRRPSACRAAGKRPRGKCPKTDVAAHAADLAQAQYACEGLRYLSGELRHLLGVVVLTPQGIMPSAVRQGELEALLALLDELSQVAPASMQHELARLVTLLGAALPQLVLFAPQLDALQEAASGQLGAWALHLVGWAWQRRAVLGPSRQKLLEGLPPD